MNVATPPATQPTPKTGVPHSVWPRVLTHAAWRNCAVLLMVLALMLLLAGWVMPELWRPAWAARRPLAFLLFGIGALLMWLRRRQMAEQQHRDSLTQLTQAALTHYDFAPATLPMEEPPAPSPSPEPDPALPVAEAAAPALPPAHAQWSPALLREIEWRRFEALCEAIFEQDGYVTRSEPHGSESGADIRLHSRLDLEQPVRIVQCRPWHAEAIAVAPVREFLGAMVDAGLVSGAFMTAGSFTPEAEALARRHAITLIDGPALLTLILRRPELLQRQLLAVATQGDYARPTCRRCGRKMDRPATPHSDPGLWVCAGQPDCNATLVWNVGPGE